MSSIDGRIDCAMTEKIGTDDYYEALDSLHCDSTLEGRVTVERHCALPGKFSGERTPVEKPCRYKAAEAGFQIFIDTLGTLSYPESDERRLCLLSEKAPVAYLDYLKSLRISYIVCGSERVDLKKSMEILFDEFGVKRLALVGGGRINGAFLSEGLVDEISLMVAPGIDGRAGEPCVFDGLPNGEEPFKLKLLECRAMPQGTIWAKYALARDRD